jgi:crotonobetainyl-CoA:carnitine CoA-transferase CaiB-like acyl-CoA transferase
MKRILEGIRVIEWAQYWVGPFAASMLGDLGAEVIKLEPPIGDGMRHIRTLFGINLFLPGKREVYFEIANRNKKSVIINLKKQEGKDLLYNLIEKSDVFLTNYRLSAAKRLGLDYDTLSKINQRLIYSHSSAYGLKGPDSELPAWDLSVNARSGMMTASGPKSNPALIPTVADMAGIISQAYGILTALLARERYGIGQEVFTSQLGGMISFLNASVGVHLLTGQLPYLEREKAPQANYNWYKCKDGRYIAILGPSPDEEIFWERFCKAIEKPELSENPKFNQARQREKNHIELIHILDQVFTKRDREEWLQIFSQAEEFPYGIVANIEDLQHDPQVVENDYIIDFDHPVLGKTKFVGIPFKLTKTPASIRTPAPDLGEHTTEVLSEVLGIKNTEISRFKKEEIIG